MTDFDQLWERFPRSRAEFERRFRTEADCRAYLIEMRWGGRPRCFKCDCARVYELSNGRFECSSCGHQTSVTAGTLLDRTRKPLRLWFRAIFEMLTRKTGVSGKDLQRLLGFGSYETAWTWLHKLRALLIDPDRQPLRGSVQLDEVYLGGKAPGHQRGRSPQGKAVILVGAEVGGRIRMQQIPDTSAASLEPAVQAHTASGAILATDFHQGYTSQVIAGRGHIAEHAASDENAHDPVQWCHWAASNLKRWWLGTHHGAISEKHLQAYLEEFTFRYNRRKTLGVGRIVARALQQFGRVSKRTMRHIVNGSPIGYVPRRA